MFNFPIHSTDELQRNRRRYERLLALAHWHAARSRYDLAVAWSVLAADHAWHNHPGFFVDERLEQVLARIGTSLSPVWPSQTRDGKDWPHRVLHVLTEAYATGGHTRLVWRWIEADRARHHGVVLTRQREWVDVPQPLVSAPRLNGGSVRALDWCRDPPVALARQLRCLAADFDLVVVHAHPFDAVPVIAFANAGSPPVILLNHAGFSFWIGRYIADVVACLRPSSREIAIHRRGIEPDRCPPLAIPVSEPEKSPTRSQARAKLGLSNDAIVLFTVASPFKYLAFEAGRSFVELITSVAQAHEQVQVLAIGPEDEGSWLQARQQTGGRVRALGWHPDASLHERAADLYLDPFPVTSPTSFLEAASYGLPIVSFCPHRKRAAVLCADDFLLDDLIVRADNAEVFSAEMTRLIKDAAARDALGRATATAVMMGHGPEAFARQLTEIYSRAASIHQTRVSMRAGDLGRVGTLDNSLVQMQQGANLSRSLRDLTEEHLDVFPRDPRKWFRLNAGIGFCLAFVRAVANAPRRESSGRVLWHAP